MSSFALDTITHGVNLKAVRKVLYFFRLLAKGLTTRSGVLFVLGEAERVRRVASRRTANTTRRVQQLCVVEENACFGGVDGWSGGGGGGGKRHSIFFKKEVND